MADYKVTDTELTSIANAIRTKGGTQAQLEFPTGFVSAVQAIPTGGGGVVQPLSVTQNGTYNPPSGVDGYSPVTVNVSGGGDDWQSLKNYIESSGTQYIDTGYVCTNDSQFEAIANIDRSTSKTYGAMFGCRDYESSGTNAKTLAMFAIYYSKFHFDWATNDIDIVSATNYYNKKNRVKLTKTFAGVESEDGYSTSFLYANAGTVTQLYPVFLFAMNQGGSVFNNSQIGMKLYRFRIYESGTLVHEFIPWQDNGVACLKDTVTGNIKYNAGTGDFVYGTDS